MGFDQERGEGVAQGEKDGGMLTWEEKEGLLCTIVSKLAHMLYFVCEED